MRQSDVFTKTLRDAPADEKALNAQLLIRAGFVSKRMAGVYEFLPLGLRVLNKIEEIVREEMHAIGGQELRLTALQPKSLWEEAGRWDDEVMFHLEDSHGGDAGLGFTHEEPLTDVVKTHVSSYRHLPFSAYQIENKFRNEARAKSGLLRGREFLMKDLYSFHKDDADLDRFYEIVAGAYRKVFERAGFPKVFYIESRWGNHVGTSFT